MNSWSGAKHVRESLVFVMWCLVQSDGLDNEWLVSFISWNIAFWNLFVCFV